MAGAGTFPKTATLDTIYQADYNTIQSITSGVLSTYYGQTPTSSQVASNPLINDAEWDNLRVDINKCYKHITGSNSTIADVAEGTLVLAADANAYKTAADYIEANKTTVNASQQASVAYSNTLFGSLTPWNGLKTFRYTFDFASSAAADYFFNLGGKIVLQMGALYGTTAKDNMWRDVIIGSMPVMTYDRANWVTNANINQYSYGNVGSVYQENYARLVVTKVGTTQLDCSIQVHDADVGDQTGLGPAEDENVNVDVNGFITVYNSIDAIIGPTYSPSLISNF